MHLRILQYDDDNGESAFSLYSTGKSGIEKYSKPGVDGYLVQLNALLCPLILERQKEINFPDLTPGPARFGRRQLTMLRRWQAANRIAPHVRSGWMVEARPENHEQKQLRR
jgi:hypothetical protein